MAMDRFFQDNIKIDAMLTTLSKYKNRTFPTNISALKQEFKYEIDDNTLTEFFKIFDGSAMSTWKGNGRIDPVEYAAMLSVLKKYKTLKLSELMVMSNSKNKNNPIYNRFIKLKGNRNVPNKRRNKPILGILQYVNKLSTRNGEPLNNVSNFKRDAFRTYLSQSKAGRSVARKKQYAAHKLKEKEIITKGKQVYKAQIEAGKTVLEASKARNRYVSKAMGKLNVPN